LDLAFTADDGHTPERFCREVLYEDEHVCVVSKEHASKPRITLKDYVKSAHIAIGTLAGRQTIAEQRLATLGLQRTIAFEVPYFSVACRCVAGTPLIATVPSRMAQAEPSDPRVKLVGAPAELGRFGYLMVWHQRVDSDAAHAWLRSQIRTVGRSLPAPKSRPGSPSRRRDR
jgi:DNA-binding transcriptional LysR family regulator